jgi:hypothetical protein
MGQIFSSSSSISITAQEESQTLSKRSPIPTTAQQTFSPSIPLIFREFIIMSIKDEDSQLMLAETCKMLYEHYELHYKDKTAVVLCDPQSNYADFYNDVKLFQLFNGCLRLKFSSIGDLDSSDYPVKILCLNQDSDLPKGLNNMCVHALVIISPVRRRIELNELNDTLKTFATLRSLSLSHAVFSDNAFSKIPNFSSIEFIILRSCKIDNDLFEKCTIPQIQLEDCKFSNPAFIKLPSSLEIFEIHSVDSYQVDASDCIKLNSL